MSIAILTTLAHWLTVTRPAVTAALKRPKKDGLVVIKSDGRIQLTSGGRQVAERTPLDLRPVWLWGYHFGN